MISALSSHVEEEYSILPTEDAKPVEVDMPELDDLDRALASPCWKVPGGKRDIAAEIVSLMPHPMDAYFEPFFGGGAVFFELYRQGKLPSTSVIADFDRHIIDACEAIKFDPSDLHTRLEQLHEQYKKSPKEAYYAVRDLWNHRHFSPAKMIFLRQAAFNGLWRENSKGQMNAPWSKRDKLSFPSLEKLKAVSAAFQNTTMEAGDFSLVMKDFMFMAGSGHVVYVDPPYLGGWVDYNKNGWNPRQAEQLVELCAEYAKRGSTVIMSHTDVEIIREIVSASWSTAKILEIEVRHKISRDGAGRTMKKELLVTNSSKDLAPRVQ